MNDRIDPHRLDALAPQASEVEAPPKPDTAKTAKPARTQVGYVGQSVPRANAKRLLQGRGAYTDDLKFPRLAHAVFFRSPHAHARIKKLDLSKAARQPGVIAAFDGRAIADYCTPWVAVLGHLKGIKSPPQHARNNFV